MAEQICNPESSTNDVLVNSVAMDSVKTDKIPSILLNSPCDRITDLNSSKDDSISCRGQSQQCNSNGNHNETKSSDNTNGDKAPVVKPSLFLRPSTLSTPDTIGKCPLKSPKLNLAISKLGGVDGSISAVASSSSVSPRSPYTQPKTPGASIFSSSVTFETDQMSSKPQDLQSCVTNPFTRVNLPAASSIVGTAVSVPNFVFGQNLHERVSNSITPATESAVKLCEPSTSNGTSEMLFSSVLSSKEGTSKESGSSESSSSNNAKDHGSLLEDAARCEEARSNKRKYEEVMVTTGEEGEENILQVNVKLFAFDNGAWVERGRGALRLNDRTIDSGCVSRIVIRTLGSFRVVLNTTIWSGMAMSRASDRSVRLTAMDSSGHLRVFLIQASPKDMALLYRCLEVRVKRCLDKEEAGKDEERANKKMAPAPGSSNNETET